MKIAIGNDHTGVALKRMLVDYLSAQGHEIDNLGTDDTSASNYPVIAARVANAVVSGQYERGILICGTGIGISIAANKVPGVRCALCSEPVSAKLCRSHNNANIVAMGARMIGPVMAQNIVDAFLNTDFDGGRHQTRLDLVTRIEKGESLE